LTSILKKKQQPKQPQATPKPKQPQIPELKKKNNKKIMSSNDCCQKNAEFPTIEDLERQTRTDLQQLRTRIQKAKSVEELRCLLPSSQLLREKLKSLTAARVKQRRAKWIRLTAKPSTTKPFQPPKMPLPIRLNNNETFQQS
jgi:hypothetical protein